MEQNEIRLLLDLWTLIKDLLPAQKRETVAEQFLQIFEDNGYDLEHAPEITDEDPYLNKAYNLLYDTEEDEEDY